MEFCSTGSRPAAGGANIAAALGVQQHEVERTVDGDTDLNGTLGTAPADRNGDTGIRISSRVSGDAVERSLRAVAER